jgi:hypothetical protein
MDSKYKTMKNNTIVEREFDLLSFEEDILLKYKDILLRNFLKIEKLF